jgi:hypothetical protein
MKKRLRISPHRHNSTCVLKRDGPACRHFSAAEVTVGQTLVSQYHNELFCSLVFMYASFK